MSEQPREPRFDDRFWTNVFQGADRVRALAREELVQAEMDLVDTEAGAEVVPVFTGPFWTRVNQRAARVNRLARDELAGAEERLAGPASHPAGGARRARRAPWAPLRSPRIARLGSFSPRARVHALAFVTSVLTALLVLPQLMPIASLAEGGSRNPLAILFSGEPDREPESGQPARDRTDASSANSPTAGSQTAGPGPGSASSTPDNRAPGGTERGAEGEQGAGESADGTGADGASAEGASSRGEDGEPAAPGGTRPTPSPSPSPSPVTVPATPSNLLVSAVDDTSVRLRWKDNSSNETGFVIEMRGERPSRQTVEADSKSFIWEGLEAGTEACFRIRARNSAGSSDWLPAEHRCVTTHETPDGAGPVVLEPISCDNEGTLSAGAELQETEIVFQNQTGQAVNLHALNRQGVRASSATRLEPAESATISTFLGHPYVVTTGDEGDRCLAIFRGRSWSSVAPITSGG